MLYQSTCDVLYIYRVTGCLNPFGIETMQHIKSIGKKRVKKDVFFTCCFLPTKMGRYIIICSLIAQVFSQREIMFRTISIDQFEDLGLKHVWEKTNKFSGKFSMSVYLNFTIGRTSCINYYMNISHFPIGTWNLHEYYLPIHIIKYSIYIRSPLTPLCFTEFTILSDRYVYLQVLPK